jgi:hypothetical protein
LIGDGNERMPFAVGKMLFDWLVEIACRVRRYGVCFITISPCTG